jgi:hypothetical protein
MRALTIFAVALAACGSGGTDPHDMSADEHREVAAGHHTQGDEATPVPHRPSRFGTDLASERDPAAIHHAQGERHGAAAEALDAEVARSCEGVSPEEQARCMFAGGVLRSVEHVDGGAVLHLTAALGDAAAVEHRARCHYARMAQEGFTSNTHCPLGARDLVITASAATGGVDLRLTSENEESARTVRDRAHAIVGH